MKLHPGGESVLAPFIGMDATEAYRDPKVHQHGAEAKKLLTKFLIGYLAGSKNKDELQKMQDQLRLPSYYGVDLTKGLLWQMYLMENGPKYSKFIDEILITQAGTLKYFDTPFVEYFSRSYWWSVPLIWGPVTCLLFYWAALGGISLFTILTLVVFAPFVWNFFEYFLHRYLFHMEPNTPFMRWFHFMLHGYHHIAPMDHTRLTFPTFAAGVAGVIIYSGFSLFFSKPLSLALMGSVVFGYIMYDLTHYYLHHAPSNSLTQYFASLRTHHLYHHYKNHDKNFGITMSMLDYVFISYDTTMMTQKQKSM